MNGSRKRSTAYDTQSYYFIMVARRLVAPGERRVRGMVARFFVCVVDSWPRALSCGNVWWTVVSGLLLLDDPMCGETQEEISQYFCLRRSDDGDDGTSCHLIAARVVHAQRSSCCRIWTRRCSASDQQSRDSSSLERP